MIRYATENLRTVEPLVHLVIADIICSDWQNRGQILMAEACCPLERDFTRQPPESILENKLYEI